MINFFIANINIPSTDLLANKNSKWIIYIRLWNIFPSYSDFFDLSVFDCANIVNPIDIFTAERTTELDHIIKLIFGNLTARNNIQISLICW